MPVRIPPLKIMLLCVIVTPVVIHDWQYHKPTKKTEGGRNFTKMNKKALEHGLHTSGVGSYLSLSND